MIYVLGFYAAGFYMWRSPGVIVRIFALLALFCGTLAALSLAGAL
jgi:hypothetical protein